MYGNQWSAELIDGPSIYSFPYTRCLRDDKQIFNRDLQWMVSQASRKPLIMSHITLQYHHTTTSIYLHAYLITELCISFLPSLIPIQYYHTYLYITLCISYYIALYITSTIIIPLQYHHTYLYYPMHILL